MKFYILFSLLFLSSISFSMNQYDKKRIEEAIRESETILAKPTNPTTPEFFKENYDICVHTAKKKCETRIKHVNLFVEQKIKRNESLDFFEKKAVQRELDKNNDMLWKINNTGLTFKDFSRAESNQNGFWKEFYNNTRDITEWIVIHKFIPAQTITPENKEKIEQAKELESQLQQMSWERGHFYHPAREDDLFKSDKGSHDVKKEEIYTPSFPRKMELSLDQQVRFPFQCVKVAVGFDSNIETLDVGKIEGWVKEFDYDLTNPKMDKTKALWILTGRLQNEFTVRNLSENTINKIICTEAEAQRFMKQYPNTSDEFKDKIFPILNYFCTQDQMTITDIRGLFQEIKGKDIDSITEFFMFMNNFLHNIDKNYNPGSSSSY